MKKSTILIPLAALALSGCVFTPSKPSGGTTGGNPTSQEPAPGDSGTPQPGTSDSSGGGGQIDPTTDTSGTPTPQPGVTAVTFAEAKTIIDALEDGAVTAETYEVTGFVTGQITKSSKNQNQYWFNIKETESSTDEMVCYYLDGNGVVPLVGMQVKCTSQLRKYVKNSQVQYQLNEGGTFVKLADPVTPEPPTEAITVAQALEVINGLSDGGQTSTQYIVRGYALAAPEASTQVEGTYRFNIADEKNATSNSVQVYWLALEAGSEVPVKDDLVECTGYLKKFVKNSAVTPEIMNGTFKKVSDTPATPTVNSVSVSPAEVTKYTGDASFTITPTVSVSGGAAQTVSWSVSQGDSVSVNNGTVSILKAGVSKVRATSTVDSSKYAECTVTVNESAATSVTVTPATQTLQVNTSQAFSSSVEGVGNFTQFVTWSVIPASAGTITTTGMFTAGASAASDVKIRATSTLTPSVYGEATVQIQESAVTPEITGITGLKASTSLEVGQSETLSATVQGVGAFDDSIDWVSGDPDKVTVVDGLITAVAATTDPVTVTAFAHGDHDFSMSCAVTVTEKVEPVIPQGEDTNGWVEQLGPVTGTNLIFGCHDTDTDSGGYRFLSGAMSGYYPDSTTTIADAIRFTVAEVSGGYTVQATSGSVSGKYLAISVSGTYVNGVYSDTAYVFEYISDKTTIGKTGINSDSYVFANRNGNYTSIAPTGTSYWNTNFIGRFWAEQEVEPAVNSVSINGGNQSVKLNGSLTLSATVNVSGGASQAVSWVSSDTGVATIDSNGVVTPVAEGTTQITATSTFDSTKSATITLTVTDSSTPSEVTITKTIASMSGSPTDGTVVTSMTLDSVITATTQENNNNGKVYSSGAEWRLYRVDGGTLTISATSGHTIVSVSIVFTVSKNGTLAYNSTEFNSGDVVSINSASAEFIVGGGETGKTNGQVRITSITVIYQ